MTIPAAVPPVGAQPPSRKRGRIARFVLEQILLDIPAALSTEFKIRRRLDAAESALSYEDEIDTAKHLEPAAVRPYLVAEQDRRRALDDKAKASLLGITVALGVIFAGFTFLASAPAVEQLSRTTRGISVGALIAGVVYLLAGGAWAQVAMRVDRFYTTQPQDEVDGGIHERSARLLWMLRQNQTRAILKTNALDVSYKAIRNGIGLLGLTVLLIGIPLITRDRAHAPPTCRPVPQQLVIRK